MEENEIYAVEAPQQNPQQNQNNRKDKSGKYFYCGLITGLAMSLLIVSGVYVANRLQTGSGRKDYTLSSADGKRMTAMSRRTKLRRWTTPWFKRCSLSRR